MDDGKIHLPISTDYFNWSTTSKRLGLWLYLAAVVSMDIPKFNQILLHHSFLKALCMAMEELHNNLGYDSSLNLLANIEQ